MDSELIDSLLFQQESETLDFKVAQYAFSDATDQQKGELLKDILAFANSWKQSDAYILIGVEEVRGGRSIPKGITEHLLNRNLQQFVNSKTNRPVSFAYTEATFEDKQIGVLHVPVQERPVYLSRDFGLLKKDIVYIRRGDTTGTATPDEVLRMASAAGGLKGQPSLELNLASPSTRDLLGLKIRFSSTSITLPENAKVPLYGRGADNQFGYLDAVGSMQNRDYYRETAAFLWQTSLLSAYGVAVTNSALTVATNVIVTLEIDAPVLLADTSQFPKRPSTERITFPRSVPTRTTVSRFGDRFEIKVLLGTVQPGMTTWSEDPFYIGSRQSIASQASFTVSADNLRVPLRGNFAINIEAQVKEVSVRDVVLYADHEAARS